MLDISMPQLLIALSIATVFCLIIMPTFVFAMNVAMALSDRFIDSFQSSGKKRSDSESNKETFYNGGFYDALK